MTTVRRATAVLGWMVSLLLAMSPVATAGSARAPIDGLTLHSPPVMRHYGAIEGLPQVSANVLRRTRDGFLWVGTFGGLVRFDGHRFRTFPSDGIDGPPSRRIVSLYEDVRQRLWIGTEDGGMSLYERGRFRQLPICGGSCMVYRVFSTDGLDIRALVAGRILRVDPDTLQEMEGEAIAGNYSYSAQVGGQVLVGGQSGLLRFSASGVESLPLPDGHRWVTSVAGVGDSAWMTLDSGDLYRFDAGSRWTHLRRGMPRGARVMADGAGGLYLSDDVGGTRRLSRDGAEQALDGAERLHAASLIADEDGALWIGTPGKGLWRLRPSSVALLHQTAVPDAPGRVLAPDGAGGMWLAMGCTSLWHLDAEGRQTAWPVEARIGKGCIHSLLHDRATGALWIGSTDGELARLAGGRVEQVARWPQSNQVGIWKSGDGGLWVANLGGVGRLRLDGDDVQVERIRELTGMDVKRIVDARAGGVWVVGDRGLFRVADGTVVERWTSAEGLGARYFRAIHEDEDGVLWLGSYGHGLIRIEGGRIRQYTEADGLFDDTVSCILPGADGRLWLAGNRGIGVLDRHIGANGPVMVTLTTDDGLDPSEHNGSAVPPCADDGAGHLWFAMMIGFARVTPADLSDRIGITVPAPYIDRATLAQQVLDVFGPVELGANAVNLMIHFGAVDLVNPENVRYRYRVAGTGGPDAGWIDAGDNHSVLLPALPWGRFAFEVQARELGGPWSRSAVLRLHRPQPWYRYQWVWMAGSLASLLVLLWMTRERPASSADDAMLARLRRDDELRFD